MIIAVETCLQTKLHQAINCLTKAVQSAVNHDQTVILQFLLQSEKIAEWLRFWPDPSLQRIRCFKNCETNRTTNLIKPGTIFIIFLVKQIKNKINLL